mgnify:CR=1 FL=1
MLKVCTDQTTEITAAAVEPLTLAEAKSHLRVDIADDDLLIEGQIKAAREYCEHYTARSFVQREYRADLWNFAEAIALPGRPIISISSVKYYDTSSPEALQTWAASNYLLTADIVRRVSGASYPSIAYRADAVQITYLAGYAPTSSPITDWTEEVPFSVKQAMLILIGDYYENREAQMLYPGQLLKNTAADRLLNPWRVYL